MCSTSRGVYLLNNGKVYGSIPGENVTFSKKVLSKELYSGDIVQWLVHFFHSEEISVRF